MKLERRKKQLQEFVKEFPNISATEYAEYEEYCSLWTQLRLILALARQHKAHKISALLSYLEDQIEAFPKETPYRKDLLDLIIAKCYEYKRYYP